MFELKIFTSHAGLSLGWKIECDDLTDNDLETLANLVSKQVKFGSVYGIPRGGVRLAKALEQYCIPYDTALYDIMWYPRLVVDDVFTTGKSIRDVIAPGEIAVVIFARNKCPFNVLPIFECLM